jgi:hypothetical protein
MILNSPYVSGSLTVTGAITACGGILISGSIASASYALNTSFLNGSGSGEFVPTGSFNTFSSSILTYTGSANSRLGSIESTTASLNAASGSAITRLNALEVTSGSNITRISALEVASGSAQSQLTSLQAQTGSYATTGSNIFVGSQTITGSVLQSGSLSVNGCITSTGQIVAQTINVQQVTSSIVYSCGDNIFGTALTNTQTFCGNVFNTGSLACFAGRICSNTLSTAGAVNLGGALTGTSATFSHNDAPTVRVQRDGGTDSNTVIEFTNASRSFYIGSNGTAMGLGGVTGAIGSQPLQISSTGIATFACQVCSPSIDIMPSGIGSSTLGGIMRVVTTGTSTGIAVGQSNTNRYSHIAANDYQVFNDDFFLSTRCAFPLSIGTCYTARLTFAATGIACFACRVCAPNINLSNGISINACSTVTVADWYNTNTDDGNGLYIKAGGVNSGKYIMALENAAGCSRMMVLANGNVGIGTSSPFSRLTVNGALSQDTSQMSIVNSEGGHFILRTGLPGVENQSFSIISANQDGTGQTSRLVIRSSGNVGIGTTSPDAIFHVALANSGGVGGQIVIDNPAGSALGNTAEISFLTDAGASGAGIRNARILAVNENVSDGRARFEFHTWNGSSSAERMRITSGGNVGIGTCTPLSTSRVDIRSNCSLTAAFGQPIFVGSNDTTGPLGIVVQHICANGVCRVDITSTRYGVSGNDLSLNVDSSDPNTGGGLYVKYRGNVGIGTSDPGGILQINVPDGVTDILRFDRPNVHQYGIRLTNGDFNLNDNSAGVTRFIINTSGIACFAGTVCAANFSATSNGIVQACRIYTGTSDIAVNNGTFTTIFSSTGNGGVWLVSFALNGNPSQVGYAIVGNAFGSSITLLAASSGSQTCLTSSGLNLQLCQTSGANLTARVSNILLTSILA